MTEQNESISSYMKEDKEGMENFSQTQEEYDEQVTRHGLQEDGQEFEVAFDIQISDGSFILLLGKTEENKLILRMVDKEEISQSFQNQFSLEDLKQMNPYFNFFTNETDAINCIIKNLNESEKEIEIIDDNNLKLSVVINEDTNGTKIVFLLPKMQYVYEGEEQEQVQEQEEYINNNINIKNEKNNIIKRDIENEKMASVN